jgi:hypothetical protein
MTRTLSLLFVLALAALPACKDAAETPPPPAGPAEPATPPPTAPKTVSKPPEKQDVCTNMHGLLLKCSGNQRLRSDGHFKRMFINNCRREVARDTAYATRFAACAASTDCPSLDACSRALEKSAGELGPEHVTVLLAEGKREEAKKFCFDNGKAVEASEELHGLCHPLLEEVEQEKAAAGDGGCPFHDKH